MSRNTTTNYLKALYAEEVAKGSVSTGALARRLGIAPGTASAMLKKLESEGLVSRKARGTVALTESGRRIAAKVVRKHRLVETFLYKVLGYPIEELHAEAQSLEAAVSDTLEERLDAYLGRPLRDPHGHPIPRPASSSKKGASTKGSDWREKRPKQLSLVEPGAVVRVAQVDDDDREAVRRLADAGILPDAKLRVKEIEPFGGPIWLECPNGLVPLARGLADRVLVNPVATSKRSRQ